MIRRVLTSLITSTLFAACTSKIGVTVVQSSAKNECTSKLQDGSCAQASVVPTIAFQANDTTIEERLFTVEFNEPVAGFDINDITVTNAIVTELTGSGKKYEGKIKAISNGVVTISIAGISFNTISENAISANSNELAWIYTAPVSTPSLAKIYPQPIIDATDWQTAFWSQWSFLPQANYMRAHAYRNLNLDDVQIVHGSYTYRWTTEGSTDRGRALFKSSSVFNSEALGAKLFQTCASSWGLPVVLAKTNSLIYFSVDTNCDGFVDILTVNLANDAINIVTSTNFTSIFSIEDCFVGDKIVVNTYSVTDGYEIWSSDGTSAGTGILVPAIAGLSGNPPVSGKLSYKFLK